MRYRWDGFLGQDMETAPSMVPAPEPPGGGFLPGAVIIDNALPPADQALPVTMTNVWAPGSTSPWPIIPEAPNPYIPESGRVSLPAPTPSPTGPNNAGIFADIASGISRILTPIVQTGLPLLERYGVLRPKVGPARLPLPGEPGYAYAYSVYGPRAVAPSLATMAPWLIGGGLVLVALSASRGRRRR